MHQNLTINLWQLNYSKNNFKVLVPGGQFIRDKKLQEVLGSYLVNVEIFSLPYMR